MAAKVMTANRLREGGVVYLDPDGHWSDSLGQARVAAGEAEADALLALAERAVADRLVVLPYLIDVVLVGGAIQPLGSREIIRASGGPTTIPPGVDAGAALGEG